VAPVRSAVPDNAAQMAIRAQLDQVDIDVDRVKVIVETCSRILDAYPGAVDILLASYDAASYIDAVRWPDGTPAQEWLPAEFERAIVTLRELQAAKVVILAASHAEAGRRG
jgi:hypothetical protein